MKPILSLLLAVLCASVSSVDGQTAWRSQLYPDEWRPLHRGGSPDSQGRFLPDFSYAGYRMGEAAIPTQTGSVLDVTQPPYLADSTGTKEATAAIQQAIDDAAAQGGGTVYLPAGTYRLTTGSRDYGLHISESNVLLKGAGPESTFLFMDQEDMREKTIILAGPRDILQARNWFNSQGNDIALTEDLTLPTLDLKLERVDGLNVGDWIVVRTDCTDEWAGEHGLADQWGGQTDKLGGVMYYRQITDIDDATNTLRINIPTRYWMKRRDNARVYRPEQSHISEVGLTGFSIGQRQKSGTGFETLDYQNEDAAAYDIHAAHAIILNHVVDGWIANVNTYRPPVNTDDIHIPSNGLLLFQTRNVTVENTRFGYPQYEGGGGNGYAYNHRGSDNLLRNATAVSSRHGFSLSSMWCTGNVIQDCSVEEGFLVADFHQHLSHANLVENFRGDSFEAVYRPFTNVVHGHTGSQNVFWRFTNTDNYQISSQQWGWGYVIGADAVSIPDPVFGDMIPDYQEGTGQGGTLEPQSLYQDQLRRRLASGDEDHTATIVPVADAFVRAAPYEHQNYGTVAYLHVKDGSSAYDRQGFLRFNISDWKEDAAKVTLDLRIVALGGEPVNLRTIELRAVRDTTWSEQAIVWNTKPEVESRLATIKVSDQNLEKIVSIDVTDYVNAARRQGDQVSFALVQPTNGDAIVGFGTRESSYPPQLRRSGTDNKRSAPQVAARSSNLSQSTGNHLRIYQPTPDQLTVVAWDTLSDVSLIALSGRQLPVQVATDPYQPSTATLHISEIRRGVYLVKAIQERKVVTRKVWIE